MVERPRYIITFDSPNNSMQLYKLFKDNRLKVTMIQTPCTLTAGCARSIEVLESDITKAIQLIKESEIEIRAIHKKFVNEKIRRYSYEAMEI